MPEALIHRPPPIPRCRADPTISYPADFDSNSSTRRIAALLRSMAARLPETII
jgi:hypothetical protein